MKTRRRKNPIIRISEETRDRIDSIRGRKGWTVTETVRRAVDALVDCDNEAAEATEAAA